MISSNLTVNQNRYVPSMKGTDDVNLVGKKIEENITAASNLPNDANVRQKVKLSNGEILNIPVMMGSSTTVMPVFGQYLVVTQLVVQPKPAPKIELLTEQELVDRFSDKKTDKKLNTVA